MNFACGQITVLIKRASGKRSTCAASNSAFGTDPRAAKVIKVINGVHIQVSTKTRVGKAKV